MSAGVAWPRAFVAFCGESELPWVRLLRPGFRHCFVVLNDGQHWITVDPLSTFTEVAVHPDDGRFNMPAWLAQQGLTVVSAPVQRDMKKPAPWAPLTCVESVKRVLGIHAARVLTPWQLYRFLRAQGARPVLHSV